MELKKEGLTALLLLLIVILAGNIKAAQLTSSNYEIIIAASSSGGVNASSTNYGNKLMLGTTTGEISSSSYNLSLGFWHVAAANYPPRPPVLIIPGQGAAITNRPPTFTWNNSFDAESDTLSYQILVDDSSGFGSPEINVSSISESTSNTSYTSTLDLELDTTYYWKVRGNDSNNYGNWSGVSNFTLQSYIAVSIIRSTVAFGAMGIGDANDTTDDSPLPFLVENSGNVFVNVTVTGTQLFTQDGFPSDKFRFKIDENETGSYNTTNSTTSWTNVTNSSSRIDVADLNWSGAADTFETELKVTVPLDEGAGVKSSTITFTAVYG